MEAEVAKHRIKDLKFYSIEFKKEIIKNYHLKELCEVEEAYIQEFNEFNKFWGDKMKEFEDNSHQIKINFEEKQKQKYDEMVEKLSNDMKIKKNCITNDVLNLQKIEQTLARQKNYIGAQKTRMEWQEKVKQNFVKLKNENDKHKVSQLENFEEKQRKEEEEFNEKLQNLASDQEKTRKGELEKLILKYEKIKKELGNLQETEKKNVEKDLPVMIQNPDIPLQVSTFSHLMK